MKLRALIPANNRGGTAVEFAILLPVWLMLFFGMLDYGWYLTNLLVLENAVATGARAGVKVKYWLEEGDEDYRDPVEVAKETVQNAFWISKALKPSQVEALLVNRDNEEVKDPSDPFAYLQVRVRNLPYTPLVGYLPESFIPQKIGAFAMTVFP